MALLLAGLSIGAAVVQAQQSLPSDPLADYARLRELTSADPWSGSALSVGDSLTVSRFRLLPAEFRLSGNSARPWGWNDGPIWQGRGATLAASAGLAARWKWFSAQLRPMAIRNANTDFALSPLAGNPGLGPYAYPTGVGQWIDMPQRFGADPFTTVDLGQSFIRADLGPVALGLSNENLWWGPARRNAIIMTNNAPGFGHAFLGTSKPANVRIGTVEARWHWARLRESEYFDANAANDSRFHTGLTATFRPKGAPGLEIGATRTFILAWREGGPDFDEALLVFLPLQKKALATPENPTGDDETDQMASLFVRWAMPAAGFEVYGEWGRGDHSWDIRDVLIQPEHASGWMLGMQKVIDAEPERVWRLGAEVTLLGGARTVQVRPPANAFYAHHLIRQGYTQRGQVMGAGIGPGSSQASLSLDRFARWGKVGGAFVRTVYDNNRFYAEPRIYDTNEAEPALTVDALVFRGPWDLGASVAAANLLNKHYVRRNDEMNLNVNLSVRYHFGAR